MGQDWGRQDEQMEGMVSWPAAAHIYCAPLSLWGSMISWESLAGEWGEGRLTYKTAVESGLGDGAVIRIATQIQLLIQVQALEFALWRWVSHV